MSALLPALDPLDRLELLEEIGRLGASGRWGVRQQRRLGYLILGLGIPSLRPTALDRWHASDLDCLLAGYALRPALLSALGARLDDAARLAVADLLGRVPEAPEAPQSEDDGTVLPPSFRLAGHTEREAALRALRPGATEEDATLRARVGEAQRAHQAGELAAWVAAQPDAVV